MIITTHEATLQPESITNVQIRANMTADAVREEVLDGKEYLVGPVIMLQEDVLNGIFYPSAEIKKSVLGWNGRPIPIYHPEKNGQKVTANAPDVYEKSNVGHVFNAKWEDEKLKGELWLDKSKLAAVSPETIKKLEDNEVLEVSTGLFLNHLPTTGMYKNKPYSMVGQDFMPDHLAILPNTVGAFSVEAGAGFPRCNEEEKQASFMKRLFDSVKNLFTNRMESFDSIQSKVREALKQKHGTDDKRWLWIADMFESSVVYELEEEGTPAKLFKTSYEIQEDGTVTLGLDVEEVQRNIVYETVNNESEQEPPTEVNAMKEELVNGLIANEQTVFTEDDRESLMAMNEDTLKKLAPNEEPKTEETKTEEPVKEETTPQANEGLDVEEIVKRAKEEAKAEIMAELKANQKAPLVDRLAANSKVPFSKETLSKMTEKELSEVEAMANGDFSGRAGFASNKEEDDKVPDMPELFPSAK